MTPHEKKEIQELVEKSGNSFHYRVVRLLRDEIWTTLVSPYYSDNFTDKPREIDIIAEKAFDVDAFISDWLGTLNVRLFIECKYINSKTVFWFDEKDIERVTERVMKDTNMDHPLKNTSIQDHHYFTNTPVAKLFTSEKSHGDDNEMISKAINQNLNATVYYRNRSNFIPKEINKKVQVLKRIYYPVIVVNSFDNFYSTSMTDGTGCIEKITESFQLEVNYAYINADKKTFNEFFLIDVVSFDKLSEFLSKIQTIDVKIIRDDISWREAVARRNT